jgi:hypothetical protein
MSRLPRIALEIGQPFSASSEALLVEAGDPAVDLECGAGDDDAAALLGIEGDGGGDVQALGRVAGLGQEVRERHRVAGGVGGGQQLLGAGLAVGALGPGCPGDGIPADAAGDELGVALAADQRPLPERVRLAIGHGHVDIPPDRSVVQS